MLGDLSKLTAPAYFLGVKLMFVGVVNFGQIQKIRFVIVKIFWSHSSQFLVILIQSNKLASKIAIFSIYPPASEASREVPYTVSKNLSVCLSIFFLQSMGTQNGNFTKDGLIFHLTRTKNHLEKILQVWLPERFL